MPERCGREARVKAFVSCGGCPESSADRLQRLFGSTLAKIELDIRDRDDAQGRRGGRQQSVVGIAQLALGEDHGFATMHEARSAEHRAEAYRAQKAHFELDGGGELARCQGDGHGWPNGGIEHLRNEAAGDASRRIEAVGLRGILHRDGPMCHVQLDTPPSEESGTWGGQANGCAQSATGDHRARASVFSVTVSLRACVLRSHAERGVRMPRAALSIIA